MNKTRVFLSNNYLPVPVGSGSSTIESIGTILSNLAYFGYVPSTLALNAIKSLNDEELVGFWKSIEPSLKVITGDDRRMDDFVVYKNFPREVLKKTEAQYWIAQTFMYLGMPNNLFTEDAVDRPQLNEKINLKVLSLVDENTENNIIKSLQSNPAKWSDSQKEQAICLFESSNIVVDDFSYKGNGITIAAQAFGKNAVVINNATDVLRLAAALSDGDISLRQKIRFKKFTRNERRTFVNLLAKTNNLIDDIVLRAETWKRFFSFIHPGDFKNEIVSNAYDVLYRKDYQTLSSKIENGLKSKNNTVLSILSERPGDFMRRLHKVYQIFGLEGLVSFSKVINQLSTSQLVKLNRYLRTIGERDNLIYPPRGNWGKVNIVENKKVKIEPSDLHFITTAISSEINKRLNELYPEGFDVSSDVDLVKLQTNDQELAPYGRGTRFKIPENITFIRSASYWKQKTKCNNWFDNGWNFFDENWKSIAACCWDEHSFDKAAIFSGDPTNSKDLEGRGCQMIDLYIDHLKNKNVRYALWSVLCFSGIPFNQAEEVLGTLQWGENAEEGKLYEPSRAQMVFPLKGESKTKFVAYIDLVERELVYMDANLPGHVSSADRNGDILQERMPAFVEYLKSLPSVADLFNCGNRGSLPVIYTDKDCQITDDAYVFNRTNPDNNFNNIDLGSILNG